ncbi:transposase [Bradyrhizobium sp. ma5]|uniref:IS110 family transposase n=1 Tax=Bradyrhizobium sp. ma5 TaxID=3344828 RepID=UPI0035D41625
MEVSTIGLDLAKNVFQVHGADAAGATVLRERLRRHKVVGVLRQAARVPGRHGSRASVHHWSREIGELGHTVRLIPPAYVKPFVKRGKNDAADAEAICEAAQRPTMRFVAVKSKEQQAAAVVFRARDLQMRQRTQVVKALRAHLHALGLHGMDKAFADIEAGGEAAPCADAVLDRLVHNAHRIDPSGESMRRSRKSSRKA